MTVTPVSPVPRRLRTPGWFDLRLLLGIVLVLGSVAAGALLMTRANSMRAVLAASHDLAAGTVVTDDDLRMVRIRVSGDTSAYVQERGTVTGKVLLRALGSGDLVPASALGSANTQETTLTVPVEAENAPAVERGQRIAIWVSTKYCQALPVLADVTVQDVRRAGNGALSASSPDGLVVRMSPELALRVVTALDLDGATIRVGVLTGSSDAAANTDLPALTSCSPPSSSAPTPTAS